MWLLGANFEGPEPLKMGGERSQGRRYLGHSGGCTSTPCPWILVLGGKPLFQVPERLGQDAADVRGHAGTPGLAVTAGKAAGEATIFFTFHKLETWQGAQPTDSSESAEVWGLQAAGEREAGEDSPPGGGPK